MIWTRRRVETLQERATQVQHRIAELFKSGQIAVSSTQNAWGQFLDSSRDNTQHGIYGTSAGVQVLSLDGFGTAVKGSADFLQSQFQDNTSDFARKGDFSTTYKLCYVADAYEVLSNDINTSVDVFETLSAHQIPQQGWGDFYSSQESFDLYPTILATAAALLTLARYRQYRGSTACEAAVAWLSERAGHNGSRRPHELALATISLSEHKRRGSVVPSLPDALTVLERELIAWTRNARRDGFDLSETHHFPIQLEGRKTNKYLFLLPHCLVALALLRLKSRSSAARRYVLAVTSYFVDRLLKTNAFRPRTTQRISSVDHLWIYRLLRELTAQRAVDLVPSRILQWSAAPRWAQYVLTSLTFVVGVAAAFGVAAIQNTYWRAGLGIVGTIALSLFGRYLWEFFLKGKDK